ncbi:MAG: ABC transporter ATP-binding protein, partial [Burkholderiaceae bacterium]
LSERFSNETSLRLMEHAATLDLEDFEDSELQDSLERARRQAAGRTSLISQLFSQAQGVITIISFAAGLLVYAPWLIVLLAVALIPAFIGETYFNAQSYSLNFARTPERRELDYVRQTGASVETAKEVKIFGLNDFLIERYRTLADSFFQANRRIAIGRAGWGSALTAIGTLAYYAAYAYIVWRTLRGDFSIGDLTFLAGSFMRLRNLLENLLIGFSQVASQALYLDDLFSFFEIQPEIVPPPNPKPFPVPIQHGFTFENVGFRYPGAERWAVRNLTLDLRAREILALVGENGAGKTTLVKLLARLYDPDEGRILLDGHDLREYDLFALRANIGVIFQDFMRYHLTAADNIAVGRIEARNDRARIVAAAERSLADEVIRKLPDGYDQVLGKRFRTGIDLSGGEWQKIAIARAYMRDAQLLILDEPTAALDARAEFEVFERFKELSHGKTVVLISHRFSSVRMADRIVVLVDGAIEADGTHAELVQQRGRYAELFELQAAGYR